MACLSVEQRDPGTCHQDDVGRSRRPSILTVCDREWYQDNLLQTQEGINHLEHRQYYPLLNQSATPIHLKQ